MPFISRTPISYPKAIKLLSETYICVGESIRQSIFEDAIKRRRFYVEGIHYRIVGPMSTRLGRQEVPESDQLALRL